ncbi:SET and MYND domain-containing protein 5 [Biomphalaria glabrata]|uniref:Protein-lysine N-trimethyltransferase SMYD5 n=1 Tax=Biomphalaria glabrata TaxID=6526 RepID=A0A9W2ZXD1_BIOGL|nr:histone-lysine N-trimethyltransferase SMYD5-like isoform X1 [Biomphalaria glabrata]KAI8755726.1 SET and MYND domain-containing protein 5-like [Biomphalaria glabrata]KAI8793254.1 SET and MYND domain-containing protein 5 [Biomphalaria glabrata]
MAELQHENVKIINISAIKGKGLFARKNLKKGETIFEEKPLVSAQFSWNELYKYLACEYCLKSLETSENMVRRLTNNAEITLPYPECCDQDVTQFVNCPQCQIPYCSTECLDLALSQYHQVLCKGQSQEDEAHPLNRLLETWRSFHYPPETTSIMLIAKMIAMVKQAQDKGNIISLFSGFVKATLNEQEHIAHKLLGKQFQVQREVLRQQLRETLFEEAVQEWFTPEGFNSLLALIGTNGQGIGSSSFSHWVKNTEKLCLGDAEKKQLDELITQLYDQLDEVSGEFLDCEGSALYLLQSSCNHSCSPNAEVTFPNGNHTLAMVALQDISPEEEITISYLSCCDLTRSRHSRQKILKENYLFTCTCEKCLSEADDASVTSEEDIDSDEMDEEDTM